MVKDLRAVEDLRALLPLKSSDSDKRGTVEELRVSVLVLTLRGSFETIGKHSVLLQTRVGMLCMEKPIVVNVFSGFWVFGRQFCQV